MKQANHGAIDTSQLLSIIERVERVNAEIAHLQADKKEIFADARSSGYDVKYIKKLIAFRKLDPDEIAEDDELTKMYRQALSL